MFLKEDRFLDMTVAIIILAVFLLENKAPFFTIFVDSAHLQWF